MQDGIVSSPPSIPDTGLWVTVRTDYEDPVKGRQFCKASALFEYPTMKTNFTSGGMNIDFTYTNPATNVCQTVPPGGRMVIAFPAGFNDRGWTPLCLDTSISDPAFTQRCPSGVNRQPLTIPGVWRRCERVLFAEWLPQVLCGRIIS